MSQCNTAFDLKINLGPVIFLLLCFALKNILVLLAMLNSGELRCPVTALIFLFLLLFNHACVCDSVWHALIFVMKTPMLATQLFLLLIIMFFSNIFYYTNCVYRTLPCCQ